MVTMGGGSVGFQAGVQAADIVLVFATPRSLQGILNGQKVTLGADASIAAGPVGRSANAGTDAEVVAALPVAAVVAGTAAWAGEVGDLVLLVTGGGAGRDRRAAVRPAPRGAGAGGFRIDRPAAQR